MADFPTLSKGPSSITSRALPMTLSSNVEAGLEITRRKWTKARYEFDVEYPLLAAADHALLFDPDTGFEKTVGNFSEFNWTNPVDSEVYVVKFVGSITRVNASAYGDYTPVKFTLRSI